MRGLTLSSDNDGEPFEHKQWMLNPAKIKPEKLRSGGRNDYQQRERKNQGAAKPTPRNTRFSLEKRRSKDTDHHDRRQWTR